MPVWTPTEDWKGQDAFIIGGGPSLRGFDWSLLNSEWTIGCNTAFLLGPKVCKLCIFGDPAWFERFKDELARYRGVVFTNSPAFHTGKAGRWPWIWTLPREPYGLHRRALGWNGNTGASAINLALILGAQRVFLLGFDMKRVDNQSNWHDHVIRPQATKPPIYQGFVRAYRHVVRGWHETFPERQIINVTKDSGLGPEVFPWMDPERLWAERRAVSQEDLRVRQLSLQTANEYQEEMNEIMEH